MTMKLIETKTLGTAAASINFTSIPQTFTDFLVLGSLRANNDPDGGAYGSASFSINGSTANITNRFLVGNGSVLFTGSGSAINITTTGSANTENTFGNFSLYVTNYSGSVAKLISLDVVTENNASTAYPGMQSGLFNSTSAITSIGFTANGAGGNFLANSTISLYGITKGSDGIVTTS
jgi:hypothetical protein